MSARERMARLRARRRAGLDPIMIEVDSVRLGAALIAHGLLAHDFDHGDDAVARCRLAAATEKALELLTVTSEGVTPSR